MNSIYNYLTSVVNLPAEWKAFELQSSLKKDSDDPGWASGVDDLARILLDN